MLEMTADQALDSRLAGRVAIVTGAARGIGAAIAERFVQSGSSVVLADVLDAEGIATAARLGSNACFEHLDVRDRSQWRRVVAVGAEQFGRVATVLVHNAGVMTPGSVAGTDETALNTAFGINVVGPVIGTQECLPGMRSAGGGSIVVMSSIASISIGPGFVPYALSKAANAAFARVAARELGRANIRVNSLHPGGVETPMNSGEEFADLDKDAWFGAMTIPRIGRPQEIAEAALYLACEESSYVTGTQLVVDGGQLLGPIGAWHE
jgi:3alpha(or 20beta)-hydroxysteroid dehydrogenase